MAGYFPDGAATIARNVVSWGGGDPDGDAISALKKSTPHLGVPLAVGSGIAGTVSDINQGTSPLDAIVGNIVRGGLVYGAGVGAGTLTSEFGGAGAIPVAWAADHYLPPAPQIGHAIIHGILGPPPSTDPDDPAYWESHAR